MYNTQATNVQTFINLPTPLRHAVHALQPLHSLRLLPQQPAPHRDVRHRVLLLAQQGRHRSERAAVWRELRGAGWVYVGAVYIGEMYDVEYVESVWDASWGVNLLMLLVLYSLMSSRCSWIYCCSANTIFSIVTVLYTYTHHTRGADRGGRHRARRRPTGIYRACC